MVETKPILEAVGTNLHILLFSDILRITSNSENRLIFKINHRHLDIPLSTVYDIRYVKRGFFIHYFVLSFAKSQEQKGVLIHFRREIKIRFKPKDRPSFDALRDAINRKTSVARTNAV
jgi:hypothetical protein